MPSETDGGRYRDGIYLVRWATQDSQGNPTAPALKPVHGPFPDILSARSVLDELRETDPTLWLVRYVSVKDKS